MLTKIFKGDKAHRSRFHDEKGNRISAAGLAYLPHCAATTLLRVSTGWRPVLPWISYRAMQKINRILTPESSLMEFGSGMSTVWYSQRCKKVVSIEDNEQWYHKIDQEFKRRKIDNVDYNLLVDEKYYQLDAFDDESFDFIVVDGSERGKCVASSLKKLKPKGYVYLDNSDKFPHQEDGDIRIAEKLLLKAAEEKGGTVQYFVDLVPTYLVVTQGMLVQL